MTDLTKDEVSAVAQKAGCAWLYEPLAQRFAALCRAPLVEENEGLKEQLKALGVYNESTKAELARVREQEPFAWARPDAVDASQDFRFIKIDDFTVPLYATPPSAVPVVAQLVEALDAAATSLETISRLAGKTHYVGDDGDRVETYMGHHDQVRGYATSRASVARDELAAGQQYLKENGK